jgi:NADH-quinone oxidoreductase subunit C
MASLEQRRELVREVCGGDVTDTVLQCGELIAIVRPQSIHRVVSALRDDPRLAFNHLSFVTASDRLPHAPRFEVVYELYSHLHKHRVRLKCLLEDTGEADGLPEIDSITDIFLTANWHEREAYDLMGINFIGHPDLRRIVLPDLWDGHPLRKEYPYDGKPVWAVATSVKERPGAAERSLGLEADTDELDAQAGGAGGR